MYKNKLISTGIAEGSLGSSRPIWKEMNDPGELPPDWEKLTDGEKHIAQLKVATRLEFPSMSGHPNRQVINEIYRAFVLLGAESDLLGTVGSWGDTLSEQDVLDGLRAWNEGALRDVKGRIEHYDLA